MKFLVGSRRRGTALNALSIVGVGFGVVGCGSDAVDPGQTTGMVPATGTSTSPNDFPDSTTGITVPQAHDPAATTGPMGGAGMEDAAAAVPGLHCDVAPIFEARCQSCHAEQPQYGAPMPLVEHADVQGMGPITTDQTLLSLISARIHDAQRPMPPSGELSADEKAAIDAWLSAGAPSDEGRGCSDTTPPGDNSEDPGMDWPPPDADECFEFVAHAAGSLSEPHIVKAGTETHPGIVFDAPWGEREVQAVGFRPITDNPKVIHHWILYQNGTYPQGFLVGWAPGNELPRLDDDVGIYMPSGEQSLYLDLHYYNVAGSTDEPDMSGVEVCVVYDDKLRPHTATVFQSFSNVMFSLPPKQDTETLGFCRVQSSGPITVMDVFPHMHEYGYYAKLEVKRADSGQVEVWHEGGFAFDEQKVYPLDKALHPGDVVKTTCNHRNDSNMTVTYGPDTGDEMCFNFVNYYPMGELSCDRASYLYAF